MNNDLESLELKFNQLLEQFDRLSEQNAVLRSENEALKNKIRLIEAVDEPVNIPFPTEEQQEKCGATTVKDRTSLSKAEKIALFRKLFRGREDVYPVRWENPKNGKSGYSPALKNKWEYQDAKRLGDRSILPEYLYLTDKVIQQHLEGKIVIGVYPLLNDDTCWFLAVDFDEKEYEVDASSFVGTCESFGVSAYLERSRSCNGAHVWVFFEEPIPAILVRQLGFAMLTQTMERRHQISLTSYDRLFPNQDTLPRGGFGNLIALPLQYHSREKGGSVFLTREFTPAKDQWEILDSIKRVSRDEVDKIVSDASKKRTIINVPVPSYEETDNEDPWTIPPSKKRTLKEVTGPFPDSIKIVRANLIFIEKLGVTPSLLNQLRLLAAFQNPEFFKNQAMRLPVYDKPRIIDCSEYTGNYLALPRGCIDDVLSLMKQYSIRVEVKDVRYGGQPISIEFSGSLRREQESTVNKLLEEDLALLSAPTAFGKTVIAAAIIAKRGVNTLILVHRQQLIDQWKERLLSFLNLTIKSIGQIGAGKKKPTGIIDIATIQSLVKQGSVDDVVANYGQVIVDECHHISAFSFEQVLKGCKAKYILGLTATPRRKDGHHPIIIMQCGKIIQADKSPKNTQGIDKQTRSVVVRETNFTLASDIQKLPMHDLYQALIENKDRSEIIASDIIMAVNSGHYPLVLTERVEHLEKLEELLRSCSCPIVQLKGGMGKKQRLKAMKQLETCLGPRVILATGRYIGEGFDDSKLDTLFLALPISWTGTLQQYVGRLHREHTGKSMVTVYDYVDSQVPTLQRMFKKRLRGYKAFDYVLRKEVDVFLEENA